MSPLLTWGIGEWQRVLEDVTSCSEDTNSLFSLTLVTQCVPSYFRVKGYGCQGVCGGGWAGLLSVAGGRAGAKLLVRGSHIAFGASTLVYGGN